MKEIKPSKLSEHIEQSYNDLMTNKITWNHIECMYFKEIETKKDMEYNNSIIRMFNNLLNPHEYKFSEYCGLIFN